MIHTAARTGFVRLERCHNGLYVIFRLAYCHRPKYQGGNGLLGHVPISMNAVGGVKLADVVVMTEYEGEDCSYLGLLRSCGKVLQL